MNNAVGILNMKLFVLYLVYTFICCAYSSYLCFGALYMCTLSSEKADELLLPLPPERSCDGVGIFTLVLIVLEFTFGVFVVYLFTDVFIFLMSGWGGTFQTKIDRLKDLVHPKPVPRVDEIFGEDRSILGRLLPAPARFTARGDREVILGYTRPEERREQRLPRRSRRRGSRRTWRRRLGRYRWRDGPSRTRERLLRRSAQRCARRCARR